MANARGQARGGDGVVDGVAACNGGAGRVPVARLADDGTTDGQDARLAENGGGHLEVAADHEVIASYRGLSEGGGLALDPGG